MNFFSAFAGKEYNDTELDQKFDEFFNSFWESILPNIKQSIREEKFEKEQEKQHESFIKEMNQLKGDLIKALLDKGEQKDEKKIATTNEREEKK